jgi:hypothetical protein
MQLKRVIPPKAGYMSTIYDPILIYFPYCRIPCMEVIRYNFYLKYRYVGREEGVKGLPPAIRIKSGTIPETCHLSCRVYTCICPACTYEGEI